MSEHVHFEATKRSDAGPFVVRTVVRRKYAEQEDRIYRQMGYDVEVRYCGDPVCLGPEPRARSAQ